MKYLKIAILKLLIIIPIISFGQNFKIKIKENTAKRTDSLVYLKAESPYNYLPLTIISGKEKGPVFSIIAGIHGYEYPPIVAVQELIKEINPEKLKGTLVIVPIANVGSFYKRSPFFNPVDNKNLNNAFPGSESGTITDQIANWISTHIIPNSDVFLDIHGGDANEDLLPFVCYYDNKAEEQKTNSARILSEISGIKHVVSYPYTISKTEPAKYAFKQASQFGITALSIEAGKLGNVQQESVDQIKKAVYNMLQHLKMYGEITPKKNKNLVFLNHQEYVKVEENGIFKSNFKSGDTVKKGENIGTISDEFGTIRRQVFAPVSGIILYKTGTPPVNKNETLFCIGY